MSRFCLEIVGYAYACETHCLTCTEKDFPGGVEGQTDFEGSEPYPITLEDLSRDWNYCGSCHTWLDEQSQVDFDKLAQKEFIATFNDETKATYDWLTDYKETEIDSHLEKPVPHDLSLADFILGLVKAELRCFKDTPLASDWLILSYYQVDFEQLEKVFSGQY
jgi:hypothetical protein